MDPSPTWTIARGPHSEASFQPPPPAIPASCRATVYTAPQASTCRPDQEPRCALHWGHCLSARVSVPPRKEASQGLGWGFRTPPVSTPCTEDAASPPGPGPSYHPGQKLKLCLQLLFPRVPAHWVDHGWWELKGCLFGVPFPLLCRDLLWLSASDAPHTAPHRDCLVIRSNWLQISALYSLTSYLFSEASVSSPSTWELPRVWFRHSPYSICIQQALIDVRPPCLTSSPAVSAAGPCSSLLRRGFFEISFLSP